MTKIEKMTLININKRLEELKYLYENEEKEDEKIKIKNKILRLIWSISFLIKLGWRRENFINILKKKIEIGKKIIGRE